VTGAPPRVPLPPAFLKAPIAHRGLHDRSAGVIENSLAAVRAAAAAGYGIEIDLQLSADGQAMVFHDETLNRLTAETGRLDTRPAAELARIPLAGTAETIPSLAAVLTAVAGRVPLLIELKDRTETLSGTDGRLEAAAASALADYTGPVALMSFNPDMVAEAGRQAPHLPRGLTTAAFDPAAWAPLPPATGDRLRAIPDATRTGASFLSHEAADLARPRVAALAAEGLAILCWTIRSPAAETEARRHARNITFEGYPAAIPA
jgi:glycerophosphoryl diester phosphodiesterase